MEQSEQSEQSEHRASKHQKPKRTKPNPDRARLAGGPPVVLTPPGGRGWCTPSGKIELVNPGRARSHAALAAAERASSYRCFAEVVADASSEKRWVVYGATTAAHVRRWR